jgi:hypothetical protein
MAEDVKVERCGGSGYLQAEDPPPPGFSTPVPISINCEGCPDCEPRWRIWVVPGLGNGSGASGPDTSPPDDCGLTGQDWCRAAEIEVVPASALDQARKEERERLRERLESEEASAVALASIGNAKNHGGGAIGAVTAARLALAALAEQEETS